ncbi:MAG: c-type cytochrome domain-containing protein, partial [Chthoniobacteraceae bacterium]
MREPITKRPLAAGWLLLAGVAAFAAPAFAAEKLHYNRDIRPLLSDKCFFCHGPDKNKRDSGLRLDIREEALALHDGIRAIVPGKPDESEIIARITTTDADDHMPPAKAKLTGFTPAEIETLKRWIAEGTEYEPHWAFISLKPIAALKPGAESPIDIEVSAALAKRGLKFQPEADRDTLIRRVSFDITGLPPTP